MSKCAWARAKLAEHVASFEPSSGVEKAAALIRTGYLATVKTLGKITSSHAIMAGTDNFVSKSVAATLDHLWAVAKHATVAPEIPVHELRTLALPTVGELRFGAAGFKEGLGKMVQVMKTRMDPDRVNEDFNLHRINFHSPAFQFAVDQVAAMHGAAYKPWYGFAYESSLYNQALVQAIREGLKGGSERTTRVNQLLAAPTDEMHFRAMEDADYATFQNPTAVGEMVSSFKRSLRNAGQSERLRERMPATAAAMRVSGSALYLGSQAVMPFSHIPSALGGVFVDYTPLGLAKTLMSKLPPEAYQRAVSLGVGRAAVGTGALFTLGYALAKAGKLTGAWPTAPSEGAQWQTEGKSENSLLVRGRWYNLQPLEPILFPALMGANVWGASANGPAAGLADQLATAGVSMVKTLSEQPYLMGLQQVAQALEEPGRGGPKLLSGVVSVPPLVSQIATSVDPQARQARTFGQRVASHVPGASQSLPPRLDIFGRPIARADLPGQALWDVTNSKPNRADAVTKELDRLRVFPGMPRAALRIDGKTIERTPQEMNALMAVLGPQTHALLARVIQDPNYQRAPDELKATILKRLVTQLRANANLRDAARRTVAAHPH